MLTLTKLDGSRFMVPREFLEFVEEDVSDGTSKVFIRNEEGGIWVKESFSKIQELLNDFDASRS